MATYNFGYNSVVNYDDSQVSISVDLDYTSGDWEVYSLTASCLGSAIITGVEIIQYYVFNGTQSSDTYTFSGWTGSNTIRDSIYTTSPATSPSYYGWCVINITSTAPQTYTIATAVNPSGAGTVTSTAEYVENSFCILSVLTTADGHRFNHWEDSSGNTIADAGAGGNYAITFTVTQNETYTAYFDTLPSYTITTVVSPSGAGTVTPTATYYEGDECTLSVLTTADGHRFNHWEDSSGNTIADAGAGGNYAITFTVTQDETYTAYFDQLPSYTITTVVSPSGAGTVTPTATYYYGDECTLTVLTTAEGYAFDHWEDSGGSTIPDAGDIYNHSITITVTQSETFSAIFTIKEQYQITTIVDPYGSGNVTPSAYYYEGDTCDLKVLSTASGKIFDRWTNSDGNEIPNAGIESNYAISVLVTKNETYTANFRNARAVSISVVPNDSSFGSVSPTVISQNEGTIATVSATPNIGYLFSYWAMNSLANIISEDNPYTFYVLYEDNGTTLYAIFTKLRRTQVYYIAEQASVVIEESSVSSTASSVTTEYGISVSGTDGYVISQIGKKRGVIENGSESIDAEYTYETPPGGIRGLTSYSWNSTEVVGTTNSSWYLYDVICTLSYQINIVALPPNGGSVVSVNSDYIYYLEGETFSAYVQSIEDGFHFSHWENSAGEHIEDIGAPFYTISVPVTGNETYTAIFYQQMYTITTVVSPSGAGTVTPTAEHAENSTCTLEVLTTVDGYRFNHWEDSSGNTIADAGAANNYAITFTVTQDETYTAYFDQLPSYTITTVVSPSGAGTVTPTATYYEGDECTLSVLTTAEGYAFDHWEDGEGTTIPDAGVSGDFAISFTVTESATYTAIFKAATTYTIYAESEDSTKGTVSPSSITVEEDREATFTATALAGYRFLNWTKGNDSTPISTNETYTFYPTAEDDGVTLYAHFEAIVGYGDLLWASSGDGDLLIWDDKIVIENPENS